MRTKYILRVVNILIAAGLTVTSLYPVFWLVSISFQNDQFAYSVPTRWLFRPELSNYRKLLRNADFKNALFNSVQISSVVTLFCVLIGAFTAYGLSRHRFKGAIVLTFAFATTRLVPTFAIVIPTFYLYRQFNLLDTTLGLDLALIAFQLPLSILIMYRVINAIPKTLDEAAHMDGAGIVRTFWQIVLPIARPGLASSAVVTFILVWNEFLFILVLAGNKILTIPLVIASFQTDKEILWGSIAAASVISLIPILTIIIFAQKHIVSGLGAGSIVE